MESISHLSKHYWLSDPGFPHRTRTAFRRFGRIQYDWDFCENYQRQFGGALVAFLVAIDFLRSSSKRSPAVETVTLIGKFCTSNEAFCCLVRSRVRLIVVELVRLTVHLRPTKSIDRIDRWKSTQPHLTVGDFTYT